MSLAADATIHAGPETAERAEPPRRRRRTKLRASLLKIALVRSLYGLGRRIPPPAVVLLVRGLAALARAGWALPGNPLRQACLDVAAIAAARGIRHDPRAIYARFLSEIPIVMEGFVRAYHDGPAPHVHRVDVPDRDVEMLRALLDAHGGLVLCVPHNTGAAFSGMTFSHRLPTVILAKNQKYEAMERIAQDGFARLGIDAILVRARSMVEVSKRCLGALREGKVLIATVDNVYRKPDGVAAPYLGGEPLWYPWPAKLAVKRRVPIVPGFVTMVGARARTLFGEPLVPKTIEEGVRHYVRYLDRMVLEDPGSWAFLADRRWRERLREAAKGLPGRAGAEGTL